MNQRTRPVNGVAMNRRTLLKIAVAGVGASILAACGEATPQATSTPAAPAATTAPGGTMAAAPTAAIATTAAPAATTGATTMMPTAPAMMQASGRPDWATAAKPYQGHTVNIMTSAGPWGQVHKALVDPFVKLTGIQVNMDNNPEGDAFNAKRQSVLISRSGTSDVVAVTYDEMTRYTKGNLLQDLGAYIDNPKLPLFDMSDYPPSVVNTFMKRDGKFYGIPSGDGVQIMFYRKDLFQAANLKPPTTWPEVYTAAKQLKQGDTWGAMWDAKGIYAFARVQNLLPKELPTVDKDYRLSAFRDPQTVTNVDVWQKLYKEELASKDVLANDLIATYAVFQSGKAAMQPLAWINAVATMEDPMQSKVAGKVGYAQIPGQGPNFGGWTYVIPADAKEKEAAYLFVAWLASKEISVKQVADLGNFDANFHESVFDDKFKQMMLAKPGGAAEVEALQVAAQAHTTARPAPLDIPEWGGVGPAMAPFIQKVIAGDLSAKDGLNQAADAGEKVLADAGYYKK